MKKIYLKILASAFVLGMLFVACEKEDLFNEAEIITSFKVTGKSGTIFNASIGGDSIIIKVSPYLDAATELDSVVPVFYLSKGATVSPDPTIPQNFAQEGGVKYIVTSQDRNTQHEYVVTWGDSDRLPYGEGFSYAEIGTAKYFPELGYPGEVRNFGFSDSKQFGDLQMYHAYCGDYIVLLSRAYVASDPASPHCIKVVDKTTLNETSSFNLGTIPVANLKMITSDYKGRCVGMVTSETGTEFFYWRNPTDEPKSIGTIAENMAPMSDLSNNFQVAGDITGNAWITALAPRGAEGRHYRIGVSNGRLASDYSIIKTGYASDDSNGFQMISPLDDSDTPSFVVADTEGTPNAANSIHCYVNSYAGSTNYTMPPLWQSTLQNWWVGTGFALSRTGGRAPIASALVINGKSYVVVTSGTAWWHAAAVLTPDLQTLAHENLNLAESVSRSWSFGGWADWYWDEEAKEGYLSIWFGRLGMYTYKMTCFE